jgi:hypothetical protein
VLRAASAGASEVLGPSERPAPLRRRHPPSGARRGRRARWHAWRRSGWPARVCSAGRPRAQPLLEHELGPRRHARGGPFRAARSRRVCGRSSAGPGCAGAPPAWSRARPVRGYQPPYPGGQTLPAVMRARRPRRYRLSVRATAPPRGGACKSRRWLERPAAAQAAAGAHRRITARSALTMPWP